MAFRKNEIVITSQGRSVILEVNDTKILVESFDGISDTFNETELNYEVSDSYEKKAFFINHPNGGALNIVATPIRYVDNGVYKIKFEVKAPLDPSCKIYRDENGVWQIEDGIMQDGFLDQIGFNLRKLYVT